MVVSSGALDDPWVAIGASLRANDPHQPGMRRRRQWRSSCATMRESWSFLLTGTFSKLFNTAVSWHADALIVLSNPLTLAYRTRIAEVAAKARLPTIYLYRQHVTAGGSCPTDLTFPICFAAVASMSVGF
jgi:hypothetical protein